MKVKQHEPGVRREILPCSIFRALAGLKVKLKWYNKKGGVQIRHLCKWISHFSLVVSYVISGKIQRTRSALRLIFRRKKL